MDRVAVIGWQAVVLVAMVCCAWLLRGSDSSSTTEHSHAVLPPPGDLALPLAGSSGLPSLLAEVDHGTATGESSEDAAVPAAPDDPIAVHWQEIQIGFAERRAEHLEPRKADRAERAQFPARLFARDGKRRQSSGSPALSGD
jgi:hypothetical protein